MNRQYDAVAEIRKIRYEAIMHRYAKATQLNGKVECALCGRRMKLQGFVHHIRKEHRRIFNKITKEAVTATMKKRGYLPAHAVWKFWPPDEEPPFVHVKIQRREFFVYNGGDGNKGNHEQEKTEGDLP